MIGRECAASKTVKVGLVHEVLNPRTSQTIIPQSCVRRRWCLLVKPSTHTLFLKHERMTATGPPTGTSVSAFAMREAQKATRCQHLTDQATPQPVDLDQRDYGAFFPQSNQ